MNGQILVPRGDKLPRITRHRGLVSIDYTGHRFAAGAEIQAQNGQYLSGDEADRQPPTRSFAVLNVRGSIVIIGAVSLFGELTNVANQRYATFGTFSETAQVMLAEVPGASDPRSSVPEHRVAG